MNNPDVVINGFSHSVITNLIKTLLEELSMCYIEAEKSYVNAEKEGMKMFNNKCASRIEMLAKWMMIDTPEEFRTSGQVKNFLKYANMLLQQLTPSIE